MIPIDPCSFRKLHEFEQERRSAPREVLHAEWLRQQEATSRQRWHRLFRWAGALLLRAGESLQTLPEYGVVWVEEARAAPQDPDSHDTLRSPSSERATPADTRTEPGIPPQRGTRSAQSHSPLG
jgi:hypothetical protein